MGTAGALGRYGDRAAQDAAAAVELPLGAIVERNDAVVRRPSEPPTTRER